MNPPQSASESQADSPASADDYFARGLAPGEEPVATGTLFFVIIILMVIGAVWVIMYLKLLNR